MIEIRTIIKLIEVAYPREERNTPEKMRNLIHQGWGLWYSQQEIMIACGIIVEDWEEISNKIESYG